MTFTPPAAFVLSTSAPCFAVTYLTVEQAQQAIFPGGKFVSANVTLTPAQMDAIQKVSGVRVRSKTQAVWRVDGGGWFIVDRVLCKHEFITYAAGITVAGTIKGVEIMEYRESYGQQVREADWLAQFVSKTSAALLQLDKEIRNTSGATLSSRHVTEGVRRLLAFHAVALK